MRENAVDFRSSVFDGSGSGDRCEFVKRGSVISSEAARRSALASLFGIVFVEVGLEIHRWVTQMENSKSFVASGEELVPN